RPSSTSPSTGSPGAFAGRARAAWSPPSPRTRGLPREDMSISEPFIRRPIATSLLSVALLLVGAVAYRLLPVAPLPQVEFPVIQVQAALPGASPETMAAAVATPLERQFGRIAGITEM